MSTDFEDPQLDELLTGYARTWNTDFDIPPLAGMLAQVTNQPDRRRWLLSAVAAVLLLAVPVATVLVLHRGRSTGRPAGSVTERSLGSTPWDGALLLADNAVAVQVGTKVPCGQPIPF
ncbi:MAG TPA: hypothetical protein VH298_01130, partial [Jatrophihabitans sp.]|nr:hypothetical protein [Jatrophihabitans sp.]